ncbi:TetR/AcrR family transcriptional regulator [Litoreibacter roseus]|uniref:TetR family transcriptional regulator n=1 Tax=Litoreibacter roseus TaxID=2601869 RepID=A0A6N6JF23_9RHOB|nr:TetR/AcrR family transcriptional regulator [Litoreibacter roseus]GFE64390.1 TetR family transcriptional regulator [Litoreibacter roseus]
MSDKKTYARRKAQRPAEITAAGLAEFAENGFAATRLTDVAARAGVSKATIYLYFENKTALFEAAVLTTIVPVLTEIEEMTSTFDGPTEELLKYLVTSTYARLVGTDAMTIMRILIGEGRRFPDLVKLYKSRALDQGLRILDKIVARGVARGDLRPEIADGDPRVLIGPTFMAAVWEMVFADIDALDIATFRDTHIDILFNGALTRRTTGDSDTP